ncbi:MAG: class I adenylate-forming enzyme family protein, partial [Dehalococcoidia bacterium]
MEPKNLWTLFAENVKKWPDKPAVIYLGTRYSFGTLKEHAEHFAAGLCKLGITRGDRVIIYAPNSPQWLITFLGIQRAGAIPVPITPIYTPPDVKFICNNCDAKMILCADSNLGYVLRAIPETNVTNVIVTGTTEMLPWWKRFLGRAFDKIPRGNMVKADNVLAFRDVLKHTDGAMSPEQLLDIGSPSVILYTGGTTGFPKGVPLSHAAFCQAGTEWRKVKEAVFPPSGDVVLQSAPLYHMLGIGGGVVGAICAGGDTMILPPRVNLDGLMDWIQRYKVISLGAVPTFYRMVLEHDRVDQYDLSSLKYCLVGGDSVPQELQKRWFEKYHFKLSEGYGITEACGSVSNSFAGESQPEGCAGRLMDYISMKVVYPGTIDQVPDGEPGEALICSQYGPKRYWNSQEDTVSSFVEIDGKTWYRTKDIVRLQDGKFVFFLDREADMIKHKGYRIAAAEIERVLQEHHAVIAACAIGVPDPKVGERVKAFYRGQDS